jgi:hypothetical protein
MEISASRLRNDSLLWTFLAKSDLNSHPLKVAKDGAPARTYSRYFKWKLETASMSRYAFRVSEAVLFLHRYENGYGGSHEQSGIKR